MKDLSGAKNMSLSFLFFKIKTRLCRQKRSFAFLLQSGRGTNSYKYVISETPELLRGSFKKIKMLVKREKVKKNSS